MPDALFLLAACLANVAGLAWLALAMEVHWEQVCGAAPASRGLVRWLRVLGAGSVLASLALCLAADHASMAVLVWVMDTAAAALLLAFTLSWRPRWLGWLVLRRNR